MPNFYHPGFYALASGPDKEMYAYFSPDGSMYRITPSGKASQIGRFNEYAGSESDFAVDATGNIYVAGNSRRIFGRIDAAGNSTIICEEFLTDRNPGGFSLGGHAAAMEFGPDGSILLVSRGSNAPYRLRDGRTESLIAPGAVSTPLAISDDSQGNLFIAMDEIGEVIKFSPSGEVMARIPAWVLHGFHCEVQISSKGQYLYVSENEGLHDRNRIITIEIPEQADGGTKRFASVGEGTISYLAFDQDENLIATTQWGDDLLIDPKGKKRPLLRGLSESPGVAVSSDGMIFIGDDRLNAIFKLEKK